MSNKTHFGYQVVDESEKAEKVASVFTTVAKRYDIMNDLMSFGVHRYWKRFTVGISGIRPGAKVLDLAGGTGDLSLLLAERVGASGQVVISDINLPMLERGRNRILDQGRSGILFVQADGETLPFPEHSFHAVTIAFGLRNMTHIEQALKEAFRILKVGGQLLVLEFSHVKPALLKKLYDMYSFQVLPRLGRWIVGSDESYRYLAESIRMHPDQQALKAKFELSGFERCEYFNLSGGVVALHRGYRLD
jgi:demethylmenaquinone methyltransferase/2-methoxy-6-polyprenyl-1,4-benzoquinol methylase